MAMDKMDSSLGVSSACYFLLNWSWSETLFLFFIAVETHVFFLGFWSAILDLNFFII
jgi:hypothetical protein